VDVLFTDRRVRGYQLFGFRVLRGKEEDDIPMNSKYFLPSK